MASTGRRSIIAKSGPPFNLTSDIRVMLSALTCTPRTMGSGSRIPNRWPASSTIYLKAFKGVQRHESTKASFYHRTHQGIKWYPGPLFHVDVDPETNAIMNLRISIYLEWLVTGGFSDMINMVVDHPLDLSAALNN